MLEKIMEITPVVSPGRNTYTICESASALAPRVAGPIDARGDPLW